METKKEYPKDLLFEMPGIKGNLKDYTQEIQGYYYYKTEDYPEDKIVVYFKWKDRAGNTKGMKSIFFTHPAQLRSLIIYLSKALHKFESARGTVNANNWQFWLHTLTAEISNIITKK